MSPYDDTRVITLLREVELPPAPPDRLTQVGRRARAQESQAMTGLAGLLAVVLVGAVLAVGSLRGDDAGRQVLTVAGAAQATTDAGSARITMRMTFEGLPVPDGMASSQQVALTGQLDFVRKAMVLRGSLAGQRVEIRAIGKDTWQRTGGQPDAKWEHSTTDASDDEFARLDPATLLSSLSAAGKTVSTTRKGDRTVFRLQVPSDFFAEAAPDTRLMDVRVTVDADNLVRELSAIDDEPRGARITTAITFDDFGVEVDVQPPPADQVVEQTDVSGTHSGSADMGSEITVEGGAPPMPPEQACAMLASLEQQDAKTREAMAPMLAELRKQCAKK